MTNKDEALKMAIEALLYGTDHTNAVKACKEALEQPAQEPLTRAQQVIRANNTAQPTQEPVAWMKVEEGFASPKFKFKYSSEKKDGYIALYTSPQECQKWQGLTDDEIVKELERTDEYVGKSFFAGVRWAEQALRSKNE